jgi:hypothetical protein
MRPMTGFAEQSNLALVLCNAGLHRRKCSAPSPMTRRWRPAKLIPLLGPARCSIAIRIASLRQTLLGCVFSAEYFPLLRGKHRFRGDGLATRLPPEGPALSHAIHRYGSAAAGSPHAGRKTARFPASSLSA